MNKKGIIQKYLEENHSDGKPIAEDQLLFTDRVLDSMALVELISFLEDEFKIRIRPLDIATENLDSLNGMERFITRKQLEG